MRQEQLPLQRNLWRDLMKGVIRAIVASYLLRPHQGPDPK